MVNKYQEALEFVATYHNQPATWQYELQGQMNKSVKTLQELVSNEPYKLEELKERMWVWDNKEKMYGKVSLTLGRFSLYARHTWGEWEEGRFFRRET